MNERKIELDSKLKCPHCGGCPYYLYRRQISPGSEVWQNVLWVGNEGIVAPPEDPENICCPHCKEQLKSEAA